jgi:UDP:flavonoid glycosyltransferase YjiC (YdhE family)
MARILIATSPIPGHVAPVTALARRLVARGNDVVWYTGSGFAGQVTATGAKHEPIRHSHDWSLVHPHDVLPALRAKTGIDQVRTAFRHLDDVREAVGLPRRGRPVLDSFLSPYLYLQDCTASFEYPRSDLPPQMHFIGPLLPVEPVEFDRPEWWPELESGRRVVLVTQGTIRNEDDRLFAPTIEALASEDVLVIVTTGNGAPIAGPLPSNVRVAPFVPYSLLMPHVSAYVTNGGYGGVQMALSHGVPIVVCGATEDKPEVGARVAWSGAGLRIRSLRPTAGEVRAAVSRVLHEPSYGDNARRIAADIASCDAPTTGAELIEELARTGRPVLRDAPAPVSVSVSVSANS